MKSQEALKDWEKEMAIELMLAGCRVASEITLIDKINQKIQQEREEIIRKLEELSWYRNDDGMKELEENTDYIKVSEVIEIIKKLK